MLIGVPPYFIWDTQVYKPIPHAAAKKPTVCFNVSNPKLEQGLYL